MNLRSILNIVLAVMTVVVVNIVVAARHNASINVCSHSRGATYTVVIQDNHASKPSLSGKLCDKITFVNNDNLTREIAFGPHENHVPYDGIAERFLNKGQSFSIMLNATGNYHWHDHLHDAVQGYFSVTK